MPAYTAMAGRFRGIFFFVLDVTLTGPLTLALVREEVGRQDLSKHRSAIRRIRSDALKGIDRTELKNLRQFIERATALVK